MRHRGYLARAPYPFKNITKGHNNKNMQDFSSFPTYLIAVFAILAIWDLAWKGMGMWRAAQRGHKAWFVVILIFNTLGILPIIYLALNKKDKPAAPASPTQPSVEA